MPPRKPFRPDKNRDRGRAQHGSQGPKSGSREARGPSPRKSWEKDRPRRNDRRDDRGDQRAASSRYSAESADSQGGLAESPKPSRHRDEAGAGLKASGASYWIYGNHAVLAAIDNPQRRIRRLLQANPDGEKAARDVSDRP